MIASCPSSVCNTWQQRVAVKQWCGCWGSHIYPPYSALQQLHRHKERHHYSEPRPVNRPATWGACRLCTGLTRGESRGGRESKGRSGVREEDTTREECLRQEEQGAEGERVKKWKWLCVQYRGYFYLSWMKECEWVWGRLPVGRNPVNISMVNRCWYDGSTALLDANLNQNILTRHTNLFLWPTSGQKKSVIVGLPQNYYLLFPQLWLAGSGL